MNDALLVVVQSLSREHDNTLLSNSFSFESALTYVRLGIYIYISHRSISFVRACPRTKIFVKNRHGFRGSRWPRIRTFVTSPAFALPEDNGLINRLSPITVPLTGKQNPGRSRNPIFQTSLTFFFLSTSRPIGSRNQGTPAAHPTLECERNGITIDSKLTIPTSFFSLPLCSASSNRTRVFE